MPLRHVAEIRVSSVDKHVVEDEVPVQLCNYTDVYYRDKIEPGSHLMRGSASLSEVARYRLRVGDTVITKDSESADDIGISAYVVKSAPDLVCGYHLAILRPISVDPKYLYWSVRSQEAQAHFEKQATGMTRVGLPQGSILDTRIRELPAFEQRRIADFLDDQVSRIDNIIAARRKQIERVHASFDTNWYSRAMELDARGTAPLGRFAISLTDGPFGSSLTSAHYVDAGVRVVRLGNIGRGCFRERDRAFISPEYAAQLSAHRLRSGDVVIAGLGDERWPLGRACVVPHDLGAAIHKADCYRLRLRREGRQILEPDFVSWYLSAPSTSRRIALLARGSTRARLNTELARSITVPMNVKQQEQRAVVRDHASSSKESESQLADLNRSIELLTEYKQSLITAAVTGELDVTAARGKVPA